MAMWNPVDQLVEVVKVVGKKADEGRRAVEKTARRGARELDRQTSRGMKKVKRKAEQIGPAVQKAGGAVVSGFFEVVEFGAKVRKAGEHALHPNDVVLPGFSPKFQADNYTCGVECTRMVLAYYDASRHFNFAEIHDALGADEDNGVGVGAMRRVFGARGLKARQLPKPLKGSLKSAIDRGHPVIVLLDRTNHWAVAYGYGESAVYMADPAIKHAGRARWEWRDFKRRWSRYGLEVQVAA